MKMERGCAFRLMIIRLVVTRKNQRIYYEIPMLWNAHCRRCDLAAVDRIAPLCFQRVSKNRDLQSNMYWKKNKDIFSPPPRHISCRGRHSLIRWQPKLINRHSQCVCVCVCVQESEKKGSQE
uniref:Uncharacterized protein n=1 Tax=Daphnia magna TaxID=35525 RepID=A0A0P4XC17_9CRUS